jgi:hypothetical protein
MFYQIDETSHTEYQTPDGVVDCLFLLVRLWPDRGGFVAGLLAKYTNDFVMQLSPTHHGVPVDLARKIHDHIWDYWERAEAKGNYPADHRSRSIQRDRLDPKGVLAHAAVRDLEGAGFERDSRAEQPRGTGRARIDNT